MKNLLSKIKYFFSITLALILVLNSFSYAFWYNNEKEEILMWVNEDGTFPKNTWFAKLEIKFF